MKQTLTIIIGVLFGTLLGLGSAFLAVRANAEQNFVHNGPWRVSLTTGSKQANMYTRAGVALMGLFALNKSETIYYTARVDQSGQALRSSCVYEVSGGSIAARWWSITLYGADYFLIPNPQQRFSYTLHDLLPPKSQTKKWSFWISPTPQKGRWLPSGKEARLTLNLRLYNPSPAVLKKLSHISLPKIKRISCGGKS